MLRPQERNSPDARDAINAVLPECGKTFDERGKGNNADNKKRVLIY